MPDPHAPKEDPDVNTGHGSKPNPHLPNGEFGEAEQARYLELIADKGKHLTKHAHAVNCAYSTVRRFRLKNPDYEEAIDAAYEEFKAKLETELFRRAHDGVEKPIFYKGVIVGHIVEYSDTLLLATMKKHDRAYRDKLDANVNLGGGVLVVSGAATSADEWMAKYGPNGLENESEEADEEQGRSRTVGRA